MKILKSSDDRVDKWKLSLESKIFIALVRSLWLHEGFLAKISPETTGLRAPDPNTMSLAIVSDLLFGDAIPSREGERLIASDRGSDAGALKRLCDLIHVHAVRTPAVFL